MNGRPPITARWRAVVTYRADAGPIDVEHDFDELEALHGLVERGPSWATIERIVIVYAGPQDPITIEQAEHE